MTVTMKSLVFQIVLLITGITAQVKETKIELSGENPRAYLTSPNYPDEYTRPSYENWEVKAPINSRIRYRIIAMNLKYRVPCSAEDYVAIYEKGKKLAEYCGSPIGSGSSCRNSLTVQFSANPGEEIFTGFKIEVFLEAGQCHVSRSSSVSVWVTTLIVSLTGYYLS